MKSYVIPTMAQAVNYLTKISRMAESLEKEHKTRIAFAEMAVVMENGEVVYIAWNLKQTRMRTKALIKTIDGQGGRPFPEITKSLMEAVPFGWISRISKKDV